MGIGRGAGLGLITGAGGGGEAGEVGEDRPPELLEKNYTTTNSRKTGNSGAEEPGRNPELRGTPF